MLPSGLREVGEEGATLIMELRDELRARAAFADKIGRALMGSADVDPREQEKNSKMPRLNFPAKPESRST
jgi:hypothetical protein